MLMVATSANLSGRRVDQMRDGLVAEDVPLAAARGAL